MDALTAYLCLDAESDRRQILRYGYIGTVPSAEQEFPHITESVIVTFIVYEALLNVGLMRYAARD